MNEVDCEPATNGLRPVRRVHFHDPAAPRATVVAPSVFVAVRNESRQLLLVQRYDSGAWELPGGQVDIGESAVEAAVRETFEEAGLLVRITGLIGLFTDPDYVVESADRVVTRQQFVVCFHASVVSGRPRADLHETSDAAWFDPGKVLAQPLEPGAQMWIRHALSAMNAPHFD
jgi:8-oxo-dGTP pyrophosphatase MutT (NUDIX family)